MREKKYRMWDNTTGRFVYFDLCDLLFGTEKHLADRIKAELEVTSKNPAKDERIQDYTGFKDKNGREIYEGDIVKNLDGHVAQARWDEDVVGFALYWIEDDGLVFGTWGSKDGPYIEVIGNIYENPELLNSGVGGLTRGEPVYYTKSGGKQ